MSEMPPSMQALPPNILFYSTHCSHSREIVGRIRASREPLPVPMRYVCIDDRVRDAAGNTHVRLPNGSTLQLPPDVRAVPSLMVPSEGGRVFEGEDIERYLFPARRMDMTYAGMDASRGPLPFSVGGTGKLGGGFVVSDTYSFLSQTPEEKAAKGGGAKQLHHYTTIGYKKRIPTPEENYKADTIGNDNVSLDALRQQRDSEVPKQHRRF
jgi:hypothetical protein